MNANLTHTPEIRLTLSVAEATWLKHIMQNPLHNQTPQTENPTDRIYRRELFTTLKTLTLTNTF